MQAKDLKPGDRFKLVKRKVGETPANLEEEFIRLGINWNTFWDSFAVGKSVETGQQVGFYLDDQVNKLN